MQETKSFRSIIYCGRKRRQNNRGRGSEAAPTGDVPCRRKETGKKIEGTTKKRIKGEEARCSLVLLVRGRKWGVARWYGGNFGERALTRSCS